MQFNAAVIASLWMALAATASARECKFAASVTQSQRNGCARCPPATNFQGTASLRIDGVRVWEEIGGTDQYGALSNGDGYAWEVDGVSFHVRALGIPALASEPKCTLTRLNVDYPGVGRKESGGATLRDALYCDWEWEC
ncbi:uncharacterized protein RCC_09175 [Ramularia collo-cygni]|uniref:Uncharacterized protein n=1 Tax=Ramularia collo-cygni TaxID=112498 RepID=A0A2D3VH02_9PEZI|nr:uncharacterized protein RCC_09175 [Ramularia collo-cygni]CZT23461.1 uncharacterized protein RCC_09175 [Ramularia collo-cygni]